MPIGEWIAHLRLFFATPARQAYGFAAVGIVGLALGGAGYLLFSGSDGDSSPAAPAEETVQASPSPSATATATRTPTRTPTPTATPSPTVTTVVRPTRVPVSGGPAATATPVPPTPTPTPPPLVAGGPYCPSISQFAPPNAVGGTVMLGGTAAPAGTVVSLAFDGVVGPSVTVTVEETGSGPRAGYAIKYNGSTTECANRVGAAISVVVDGRSFATGQFVGDGIPFIRLDING